MGLEINRVYPGNCFTYMDFIDPCSVDLVVCDPPYGITGRQHWDVVLDMPTLFSVYKRILKPLGTVVLFAAEPFRTKAIMAGMDMFKYDLIWVKNKTTGFLNAKRQPLKQHESILVFSKVKTKYNPQKKTGLKPVNTYTRSDRDASMVYGKIKPRTSGGGQTDRYPTTVLEFDVVNNDSKIKTHPSQKPAALLEYLIKTYSDEGDIVLDNCCGTGSTLLAAKATNRNFIGIELDDGYYATCIKALGQAR